MGCDGGTIPRRDELVRLQKKPEQKDKDAEREFRWLHCFLTQQRLEEPIVMCGLGHLYSKQNVIEQLLKKNKMPEAVQHIKSLKDVKQLNLTPNPAYTDVDKTEGLLDGRPAPYICKLIGLEMPGKFRFIALWSCGCVMSERALKEIKGGSSTSAGGICPLCQTNYAVDDVIILNAVNEDLELMQLKMEMRNAKRKANKKEKKNKHESTTTACNNNDNDNDSKPSTSKKQTNGTTATITSNSNSNTSQIKFISQQKRRLAAAGSNALEDPDLKRLKTDYSVAADPKATDVYKSLFTTHKSEQEQDRAHWVTYNPFYN